MQFKLFSRQLSIITLLLVLLHIVSGESGDYSTFHNGATNIHTIELNNTPKHSFSAALYENDRLVHGYTINPDSLARVIVLFRDSPINRQNRAFSKVKAQIENEHRQFKTELDQIRTLITQLDNKSPDINIHYEFQTAVNGIALTAPISVIERIPSLSKVKSVFPDRPVSMNIENSSRLVGADSVRKLYNVTGKGVKVGIIDTGVDYNNPALGGGFGPGYRVYGGYDFSANDPDPMDENGHGTFVAGIIGANSATLMGISPEVQFIAARALDQNGDGYQSDIIAALEFCIDPDGDINTDDGAQIINLSLGGAGNEDDPLCQAVDQASANGILCVVSAGNNGLENSNAKYQTIDSPGTAKTALTVGASDLYDKMYYLGGKGPTPLYFYLKPELVAPGVAISSLGLLNRVTKESGTSVAAPHVSGAAALLKQQYPARVGSQLKSMLVHSAKRLASTYNPYKQGNGRLDVLKAISQNTIVEPALWSFGRTDNAPSIWSSEIPVTITNPTDSIISVQFVLRQWPEYISMVIEQEQFTLLPGETVVTNATLNVEKRLPVPANQPYSYFADLLCIAGNDSFLIPCGFTKTPQLAITFTQPALSLFLWGEDSPVGYLYSDLPETINIYLDGGRYHLFCVMQQFIDGVRHLYFLEQRNVDVHDLNQLNLDYRQANFQSQPVNYDRDNRPLTAEQLYRNRIVVLFYQDFPWIYIHFDFNFDEELIVNTTTLSDNFMFYQNKLYTPQRDRIIFLHKFCRSITSEQDFWLQDGPAGLKWYPVNMQKNHNDKPGSCLIVGATGYNARGYAFNSFEIALGLLNDENRPFNGIFEFSLAPEVSLIDETCSVYSLVCAYKDSLQNNIFSSSPGFFVNPNGSLHNFYADTGWDSSLVNLKNRIKLFTLYEGDTLSWPLEKSELLMPDYNLILQNNQILLTHTGRARGGLHTVTGHYEQIFPGTPGGLNYSLMKLFNADRLLLNQKLEKVDMESIPYPVSAGSRCSTVLYTSSPYHIYGQYGSSFLLLNEKKMNNAKNALSLLHFDTRCNNIPSQQLQPGTENTLNIYIRNGDKHLYNPIMTIYNQAGQQAILSVHYVGEFQYQSLLPDTLTTGFYGVQFTAVDELGNHFEFSADPAFYFGAENTVPEPSAFLYLEDYAVADRQNLSVKPGSQDLLKLVFHNPSSLPISNLNLRFTDNSFIQINNCNNDRQLAPLKKDSLALSVTIIDKLPVKTLYTTQLVAGYVSNGKHRDQRFTLVFGVAEGSSQVQDGAHPVDDFVYLGHYPNPANVIQGNNGVTFAFDLFTNNSIVLDIYDILGRHITRLEKPNLVPGHNTLRWDKADSNNLPVSSGLYLYRITVNNKTIQGKMIILN